MPVFCLFASSLCLLLLWPCLASEHVCPSVSASCLSQGPAGLAGGLEHPRIVCLHFWSCNCGPGHAASPTCHGWIPPPHNHAGHTVQELLKSSPKAARGLPSLGAPRQLQDPGLSFSFPSWGRWEGPSRDGETTGRSCTGVSSSYEVATATGLPVLTWEQDSVQGVVPLTPLGEAPKCKSTPSTTGGDEAEGGLKQTRGAGRVWVCRAFPLRDFAACLNQKCSSSGVRQCGMCSLVLPKALSSTSARASSGHNSRASSGHSSRILWPQFKSILWPQFRSILWLWLRVCFGAPAPSPAHRADCGHQAFVYPHLQSTGCALSRVKGKVCSFVECGITHKSRCFALRHRFRAPAASPALGQPLVGCAALCQLWGIGQSMEHIQLSFCF